eukprot:gnl/MRDRNA2_/MRDRNA2_87559_c0_seq1.p1 gnl/MRDRNA2_/MRDRNA2_87559_c0~~gnl/MRDRNA2_/MRDRNA2_87559_c0_seq1.p1  ORF type:complete len:274 (+),score=45.83 gnl/MRDRNA2_/MRDRNA2_87559_c0_seq1:90-911(+)
MSLYTQLVVAVALLTTVTADHLLRSKRHIVIEGGTSPSKLNLRLCNAFTDSTPVAVVLKPMAKNAVAVNLTKQQPLKYKSCRDWPVSIGRGDTFEFVKQGGQLGAFQVSSVPQWDATLLLIFRRKGDSARPTFVSHIFSKTKNAQLAVLDMYNGPSKHSVVIQQRKEVAPVKKGHELSVLAENLAYDSVVAVAHGNYMFALTGNDQRTKHPPHARSVPFTVDPGVSYVAMRVGTSDKPEFPEELVVFPSSAAYGIGVLSSTLVGAVLLTLLFD